jgi:hypothetical protein
MTPARSLLAKIAAKQSNENVMVVSTFPSQANQRMSSVSITWTKHAQNNRFVLLAYNKDNDNKKNTEEIVT